MSRIENSAALVRHWERVIDHARDMIQRDSRQAEKWRALVQVLQEQMLPRVEPVHDPRTRVAAKPAITEGAMSTAMARVRRPRAKRDGGA